MLASNKTSKRDSETFGAERVLYLGIWDDALPSKNSLDLLLSTDLRILDIAVSAGYENQESYTRAFRKSFDMTPGAYRRMRRHTMFLKKVEIDEDYIRHIQANMKLEPTITVQPERRIVGIRSQCSFCPDI